MRIVVRDQWSAVTAKPAHADVVRPRAAQSTSENCARIPHSHLTTDHCPLTTTPPRSGFTLVELLITVSIIAIVASMVMFAMSAAQEQARTQKTRALITKLNDIIMQRYDEYRTRRVPIPIPADEPFTDSNGNGRYDYGEPYTDTNGNGVWDSLAKKRMDGLRDLMRLEMPDRWSDVLDNPTMVAALPSATQAYRNHYSAVVGNIQWPVNPDPPLTAEMVLEHQGAECLYMIVMAAVSQMGDARDVFKAGDIGDIDGDGFPEFHDAWGMPIEFIRWAPGFQSDLQTPVRGRVASHMGGGQSVQIVMQQHPNPTTFSQFSTQPGAYLGGAIAVIDEATGIIDTDRISKVTGFSFNVGSRQATFVCETPTAGPNRTQQPAFQQHEPSSSFNETITQGQTVVIMQPDPFDSRQVYPKYNPNGQNPTTPDVSVATFALYPLIYSAGPDRGYGVKHENASIGGVVTPLRYTAVGLNPFYVGTKLNATGAPPFGLFLGGIPNTGVDENGRWKLGCHLDNIHNHALNAR